MDIGGRVGPLKLLRFNGHFFRDATALPLTRDELALLEAAARADWAEVEPAIFGTLLTRALDPEERHRLGAEYTPPAFIERVVRPTVEEPLRARWTAVEAEVVQLLESGKPKDRERAAERVEAFHDELLRLRFLDPACGSGNFLYVTMHLVKNIEVEVLRTLERVTGQAGLRLKEVTPAQFFGIEVKPWAREIAELVLWIGFHQFWRRHHDVQPPEPILQDTGTLERRDAVLAWDTVREDPARARPDPARRMRHPVTGELVPDPAARLPYREYVGVRPRNGPGPTSSWATRRFSARSASGTPSATATSMRSAWRTRRSRTMLTWWSTVAPGGAGGGRRTHAEGRADHHAVADPEDQPAGDRGCGSPGRPGRVGHRRSLLERRKRRRAGAGGDDVLAKDPSGAILVTVDGDARVVGTVRVPRLNADLTAHADVAAAGAIPLRANAGLTSQGFKLVGDGFVCPPAEAETLLNADPGHRALVRPFRNGKDLTTRPRGVYVIDFGLAEEHDARMHPLLYDRVRDLVRPGRAANPREAYARLWWRFGEPRRELREALAGLPRYIATPEVSKHRFFVFLEAPVAPDGALVCVATADAYHLGVLSSSIHTIWSLAAGARMGIDGTPRYNKRACFEAFPFPEAPAAMRQEIAALAERIDHHRSAALARSAKVGLTVVYNVVDRCAPESRSRRRQEVHRLAACGILRDLHDELDALPSPGIRRCLAQRRLRSSGARRRAARWLLRQRQERAPRPGPCGSGPSTSGSALRWVGSRARLVRLTDTRLQRTRRPWAAGPVATPSADHRVAGSDDDVAATVEEAPSASLGRRVSLWPRHLETLSSPRRVVC
jgi:hypothetical protein